MPPAVFRPRTPLDALRAPAVVVPPDLPPAAPRLILILGGTHPLPAPRLD